MAEIEFDIRVLKSDKDKHDCALLMSESEPWKTIGRSYEDVIKILDDDKWIEAYVLKIKGELIGFSVIKMKGAFTGYIQSIVLKPGWRNKGLGKKFISFLEERIFSESPNVFICASSFNINAQRLYKNLGYEVVGELKDYIIKGYSEILLRKSISPISEFKPVEETDFI
jgi:[ribosomal protein S18]-alanine N-acetyltransferase